LASRVRAKPLTAKSTTYTAWFSRMICNEQEDQLLGKKVALGYPFPKRDEHRA